MWAVRYRHSLSEQTLFSSTNDESLVHFLFSSSHIPTGALAQCEELDVGVMGLKMLACG